MNLQARFANITALLLCVLSISATTTWAQQPQRDPLAGLKRAISQASAPALTTQQETDLNTSITNFRNALPTEPDEALAAAHEAYEAAILAGDLTAAQTQAAVIAMRSAELANARLQAHAKFAIDVLANLQTGGQLTLLVEKFGQGRVLNLVNSLAGHGGPHGGPGGGGPGGFGGRH